MLSSNNVTNTNVEKLNQLTRELGQMLENQTDVVQSVSYGGREILPEGTKAAELIFAQQAVLQLIPIVTPWVLKKIDEAVKSLYVAGQRIYAKVQAGSREFQITPEMTPSELAKINQQIKAVKELSPSNRFALVIGNSKYRDKHLANLQSPAADAEQFAEVLADPNVGAFTQVETLFNENSEVIEQAVERFFNNQQRDDLLLLYFSGHGVRNKSGQLFLAAYNTMRDLLRSTGISASFIKELMDESFSQRQILILDCCYGGTIVEGSKSEQIVGQPVNSTLAFQTSGFGRVIVTASDSMQYAYDGKSVEGQIENSAFTYRLIEGLRTGKADTNNDGLIDIDELYQYAYRKVVPQQTPNISSTSQQGRIFIALNPNPTIRPAQLPDLVRRAMQSENRVHRQGAVSELASLLKSDDPSIVMSAEKALHQMTMDDSRSVGAFARDVLNQYLGKQSTESQREPTRGEFSLQGPAPSPPINTGDTTRLPTDVTESDALRTSAEVTPHFAQKPKGETLGGCLNVIIFGAGYAYAGNWVRAIVTFILGFVGLIILLAIFWYFVDSGLGLCSIPLAIGGYALLFVEGRKAVRKYNEKMESKR